MVAAREDGQAHPGQDRRVLAVTLSALGIVYGDIGTSPLYTMRTAFNPAFGLPLTGQGVLGILSLIFWALILVVTVKYVLIVLRADNRGEGGILALATLAAGGASGTRRRRIAVLLGLFGAALFYSDGLITPAISVLSAVEGLNVATTAFQPYILPIALVLLALLFMVQSRGTATVGRVFAPVMLVWFVVLGVLGLAEILRHPRVLAAVNPEHALWLFTHHGWVAFVALGAVLLAVTGAEALYTDMGHFGRQPIRLGWFGLVLPSLLLNYFGQGALLITDPAAIESNPFYLLAPEWALYPLVALSTIATLIASQALISGAFSLTRQAIQLGFLPRLEIRHTSERAIGQVYLPQINWSLLIGVVIVVIAFGSSRSLAGAYGFAVTGAMLIDSVLLYIVLRYCMRWPRWPTRALIACFLAIDVSLFASALLKVPHGGWVPLVFATAVFLMMVTWVRGRQVLYDRRHRDAPEIHAFVERLGSRPPQRVTGTAVFMTGNPETVPGALLHNLKHNKVLHERVILLTVRTEEVPRIAEARRLQVDHLKAGFHRIIASYGFVERADVTEILELARRHGLPTDLMDTSFFLARETFVPSNRPDMPRWQERAFIIMTGIATDATEFFRIPPGRVVELGAQIEI